jgi:hypothetical protein
MIRDNKLPPHKKQKKQYPHRHHVIVKPNSSQANQINANTPSKEAGKEHRANQKHAKGNSQPHYTRQATLGKLERESRKASKQSNKLHTPSPFRQFLICFRRQILCKHNSTA